MTKPTIASVLGAISVLPVLLMASLPEKAEKSPHAAALELVFAQRSAEIRQLETGDWWVDSQERGWRVSRPFDPGYIDSRHWLNVEYQIAGKPVAHWFVDTKKGTAQPVRGPLK